MIERITHNGNLMAVIILREFCQPSVLFLTPDDFSQQLAYMKHPAGMIISFLVTP